MKSDISSISLIGLLFAGGGIRKLHELLGF